MKIKGLSLEQIESAAKSAGDFRLDNVRTQGNYLLLTLRMNGCTPTRKRDRENDALPSMRFRKIGFSGHWTGAVCFHGFEAFMRECFKLNPEAIIRTTRAAYLGLADFEEKFEGVGSQNVGSLYNPMQYRDSCHCNY
jgi:hypothetical protein